MCHPDDALAFIILQCKSPPPSSHLGLKKQVTLLREDEAFLCILLCRDWWLTKVVAQVAEGYYYLSSGLNRPMRFLTIDQHDNLVENGKEKTDY